MSQDYGTPQDRLDDEWLAQDYKPSAENEELANHSQGDVHVSHNAEKDTRRWPYFGWYNVREWGWHRSVDTRGPVVQINLGRLGLTIPTRDTPPGEGDA